MKGFLILTIAEWWNGNTSFQQALFITASAATLFLILQVILLLIGMSNDGSFDSAFESHDAFDGLETDAFNSEGLVEVAGLRLVSLRSIIAFIGAFGWISYLLLDLMKWYLALPLGIIAGCGAGVGVAYAMHAMLKMQSSGNIDINNAIGKVADVYLTIPKNREGAGKVNLYIQDSYIERDALTNGETLYTGEKVLVIGVLNQGTVIVEKHKS